MPTIGEVEELNSAILAEPAETDAPGPNNYIPAGETVFVGHKDGSVILIIWDGQHFAIDASIGII